MSPYSQLVVAEGFPRLPRYLQLLLSPTDALASYVQSLRTTLPTAPHDGHSSMTSANVSVTLLFSSSNFDTELWKGPILYLTSRFVQIRTAAATCPGSH